MEQKVWSIPGPSTLESVQLFEKSSANVMVSFSRQQASFLGVSSSSANDRGNNNRTAVAAKHGTINKRPIGEKI